MLQHPGSSRESKAMITRSEWSNQQSSCFVCGYASFTGYGLETHEIARGPHKKKAMKEPSTWIRTCNGKANDCHARRLDGMDPAMQLALKLRYDEEHYDRQRVNVLRHRQPDAITEAEVDAAMRTLTQE